MRNSFVLATLALGCASLLAAGGLLLSGCMMHTDDQAYQAVVDELNEAYQVQLSVDLNGKTEITPEQLQMHLLGIIMHQAEQDQEMQKNAV